MSIKTKVSKSELIRLIEREFPKIHVHSAKMVRAGWDNVVLDVNNQWIFRFPRFKIAEQNLLHETKFLQKLYGQLSIPIPHYEYIAPSRVSQYRFAGYRKIVGTPLTPAGYQVKWTKNLAPDLASFLHELHSDKITQLTAGIFPVRNVKRRIRKLWKQMRLYGYRYLDSKTQLLSEAYFEKSMEILDKSTYEPTFVHGDLTDNNILINPNTGRLTGVLDWSESEITDPARDFAGSFELNQKLGYAMLNSYGNESDSFRNRIEIYWRLIPCFEVLYGYFSKIPSMRISGAKRLRKRLEAPNL